MLLCYVVFTGPFTPDQTGSIHRWAKGIIMGSFKPCFWAELPFVGEFIHCHIQQGELSRGCLSIVLGNAEFRLTLYRLSDNRVLFLLPSAMMHWDVRGTELEPDFEKLFVYCTWFAPSIESHIPCLEVSITNCKLKIWLSVTTPWQVPMHLEVVPAKRTYQEFQNPMCVIVPVRWYWHCNEMQYVGTSWWNHLSHESRGLNRSWSLDRTAPKG